MNGIQRVPVAAPAEAGWVEDGRLPDRAGALAPRRDVELQPAASGQLHLGGEPQPDVRPADVDAPAVEDVAGREVLAVAPAPPHADPAEQAVDETAQPPQPVAVVPAVGAADAPDGCERRGGGDGQIDGARIQQPAADANAAPAQRGPGGHGGLGPGRGRELGVLVPQRARDGLPQRERANRKGGPRVVVVGDGCRPEPVDELAADARVDRRGQAEPEARQARREQRHRDEPAPETPLPRVLAHDRAVRHDVRAADLENAAVALRQVEHGRETGHQVVERDGLRRRADPGRADHDREPLDERADQLERQAAAADHDAAPQLDDRHAGRTQHDAGFVPAA